MAGIYHIFGILQSPFNCFRVIGLSFNENEGVWVYISYFPGISVDKWLEIAREKGNWGPPDRAEMMWVQEYGTPTWVNLPYTFFLPDVLSIREPRTLLRIDSSSTCYFDAESLEFCHVDSPGNPRGQNHTIKGSDLQSWHDLTCNPYGHIEVYSDEPRVRFIEAVITYDVGEVFQSVSNLFDRIDVVCLHVLLDWLALDEAMGSEIVPSEE